MKFVMPSIFRRALLIALALVLPGLAQAAYPERPITIVVPYAPGGAADALARLVAQKMAEKLGAPVIVDNKAGASGTIGAGFVAKAQPDGYTVLYDTTPYSINPHLFPKMPYPTDALKPLLLVSQIPNILIVRADSPFKDVKQLIAKARAEPGKVNFASGGAGTVQRLASEMFRQRLGLDMIHVPYKSGGAAIIDVMGGQVDFMFSTVAASSPHIAAGKLHGLVISSPRRSPKLPDAPTVAETVIPGYEVYEWHGMFVPAGTPDALASKLQAAVVDALNDEEVKKRFKDLGAEPVGSTPAQFADYLKKEDAKWSEVVRKGNIKAD
ncbi:Bug family tripartite tricarboxylate transporter substrate binding protein [Variovorax atrisoli]|uniref:Bug family tripartite tricarboxylate transporter substrate binding protein n=1 Tax=Variovorax atrisoli TaxID=3394203 RepID=UPI00347FCB5C